MAGTTIKFEGVSISSTIQPCLVIKENFTQKGGKNEKQKDKLII